MKLRYQFSKDLLYAMIYILVWHCLSFISLRSVYNSEKKMFLLLIDKVTKQDDFDFESRQLGF